MSENQELARDGFDSNEDTEQPRITEIKMLKDGPLLVIGAVSVTWQDASGEPHGQAGDGVKPIALCRCGASRNKPFCDGEHRFCADIYGNLPEGSVE